MRASDEGFSLDAASEKGRDFPEWYLNEPYLEGFDAFYLRAFSDLSTCRSSGMALGPIPWHRILQYADHKRLNETMTEAFVTIIRGMDTAFLEHHAEKSETPT